MKTIDPADVDGRFVNFAEGQDEYHTLPARVSDGIVYTRWTFNLRERLAILFGRRLNLEIMTFDKPLQPILPWVEGQPPKETP